MLPHFLITPYRITLSPGGQHWYRDIQWQHNLETLHLGIHWAVCLGWGCNGPPVILHGFCMFLYGFGDILWRIMIRGLSTLAVKATRIRTSKCIWDWERLGAKSTMAGERAILLGEPSHIRLAVKFVSLSQTQIHKTSKHKPTPSTNKKALKSYQ